MLFTWHDESWLTSLWGDRCLVVDKSRTSRFCLHAVIRLLLGDHCLWSFKVHFLKALQLLFLWLYNPKMLFILLLSWLSCLSTTLSISNSTTTKNFILNAFFTLSKNPRQENNCGQILHPVVLRKMPQNIELHVDFHVLCPPLIISITWLDHQCQDTWEADSK